MLFSRSTKVIGAALMSLMITHGPAVCWAESGMISTHEALAEQTRSQNIQEVQDFLSRSDIQKLMVERGLSTEEASLRIASLSEVELRQLSGQVQQARAGGDILVAVLIVVLIIYLIKRI
jgi:hypothetical protein